MAVRSVVDPAHFSDWRAGLNDFNQTVLYNNRLGHGPFVRPGNVSIIVRRLFRLHSDGWEWDTSGYHGGSDSARQPILNIAAHVCRNN